MQFDLQICNQSTNLEYAIKGVLYRKLALSAQSSERGWIRISGIVVGPVCGFLTTALRIAQIVENIIKGLINLVGSFFTASCKFSTGCKQLVFEVPKNMCILPFSMIHACFDIVRTIFCIASSPKIYTDKQWVSYDPLELDSRNQAFLKQNAAHIKQQEIQKAEKDKENFLHYYALMQAPNVSQRIHAILRVADAYATGRGVQQNYVQAVEFLEEAVNLGSSAAGYKLGSWYKEGKPGIAADHTKSDEWFKRAAELGLPSAQTECEFTSFVDVQLRQRLRCAEILEEFMNIKKPPINYRPIVEKSRKLLSSEGATSSGEVRKLIVPLLAAILSSYPNYANSDDEQRQLQDELAREGLSNQGLIKHLNQYPETG